MLLILSLPYQTKKPRLGGYQSGLYFFVRWQPGVGAGLPFPESILGVLQAASALAKIKAITKPPEIHRSTRRRIRGACRNIQLTGCMSRLHAFNILSEFHALQPPSPK